MYLRNAGRNKKWWVILTVLMLIGGDVFAEYQSMYSTSVLDTLAHIEELSRSGDGAMDIYYDFEENGELRGGKVAAKVPLTSPELFLNASSYNTYTLIDNGPSENRIDLVCVGDGYTAGEMDTYLMHIANVLAQFFNEEAFREYADYFNVHVVEVISNQSGVDEPDKGIYRDTALDMAFNCDGIARLLCVNYTNAWAAAESARDTDFVLAFANTTRYGGAGYSKLSVLSGGNGSAVELALHEFGHSFAKLADEYHYSDGTTYTGSEPTEMNVSKYNAASQLASHLKWYRWLDLPEVDTFEGAKYKQYGIYRPTDNSKMRSLGVPFGPVNTEQIVLSIYQKVSPIDGFAPATSGLLDGTGIFSVVPMAPATHTLHIEWQIDGITVLDSNQTSFCPDIYLTANTTHTLKARITDGTTLVRDENKRMVFLAKEKNWQVWKTSADFNTDGTVDINDMAEMLLWWLSNNEDYDIAPPGGDGIVNFKDFAVLAEQGQSWRLWTLSADFNTDGIVDIDDLNEMLQWWLSDNEDYDIAPLGGDGIVNFEDFAILAKQWQYN